MTLCYKTPVVGFVKTFEVLGSSGWFEWLYYNTDDCYSEYVVRNNHFNSFTLLWLLWCLFPHHRNTVDYVLSLVRYLEEIVPSQHQWMVLFQWSIATFLHADLGGCFCQTKKTLKKMNQATEWMVTCLVCGPCSEPIPGSAALLGPSTHLPSSSGRKAPFWTAALEARRVCWMVVKTVSTDPLNVENTTSN